MSAGTVGGAGTSSTSSPSHFHDVDLYDHFEISLLLLANQLISTLNEEYLIVSPEKIEGFKKEIAENLITRFRHEMDKATTGHSIKEDHPISISNMATWIRTAFCENRAQVDAYNRGHRLSRIGYGKLESTLLKMASQVVQHAYAQKEKDTGTVLTFAHSGLEKERLYKELFPEISAILDGKKTKKAAEKEPTGTEESLLNTSTGSAYSFEGLI